MYEWIEKGQIDSIFVFKISFCYMSIVLVFVHIMSLIIYVTEQY